MTLVAAQRIYAAIRTCETCDHSRSDLAGLRCNLVPEQRASIARFGAVDPDDRCDQHDYKATP